jgi:hypothetical protein
MKGFAQAGIRLVIPHCNAARHFRNLFGANL